MTIEERKRYVSPDWVAFALCSKRSCAYDMAIVVQMFLGDKHLNVMITKFNRHTQFQLETLGLRISPIKIISPF
jgi:hypothetical protein